MKRLVQIAIEYVVQNNRKSVTLVYKGNKVKFIEGTLKIRNIS